MDLVAEFYKNKALREAVRVYIQAVFNQEVIDMVYKREVVSYIADANELVDKAFAQMEIDYGVKKATNNLNEAR